MIDPHAMSMEDFGLVDDGVKPDDGPDADPQDERFARYDEDDYPFGYVGQ